ncbi:DUF4397 domain-containing protein [Pengzhenrongella phosphoraccumulans]|uniref:DUF4397 domain-containing protein n=1 Tax=Pengzhenrongella phosphoraccumulans TaxID=3114394 RepID=UPI00388F0F8A
MRKSFVIAVATGALLALTGIAPAQAQDSRATGRGTAELSVLHGVPGVVVDVYVNGALTLDNFTPGTLAGPLKLAAGTYSVAITGADALDASAPIIGPVDLTLKRGKSYTAVAHLSESGTPTATLFKNDQSAVKRGQGRLTVRHVAAAPAVDVLANGAVAIAGLTNGNQAKLKLPVGTYSAAVALAGTTAPVIGPADVTVAKRTNTIVYAWGSAADGSLNIAVQTVALKPCVKR